MPTQIRHKNPPASRVEPGGTPMRSTELAKLQLTEYWCDNDRGCAAG